MWTHSELPPIKISSIHTDMRKPESCPYKYVAEKHVLLPHTSPQRDVDSPWFAIQAGLEEMSFPMSSSQDLESGILSYNESHKAFWNFNLLHHVINNVLSDEDRAHLLEVTLPSMARLALELPQLLPRPLPLLRSGRGAQISLSQRQIAALLANAFFCTFPGRNYPNNQFPNYPTINFNGLFSYHHGRKEEPLTAKLLCIFNYFKRVTTNPPIGTVTFARRYIAHNYLPSWSSLRTPMRLDGLIVDPVGKIEDEGVNMLQVSFANMKFGGGVIDSGYVQEEIRCITCTEMIVARLFTEHLNHNEALLITGVEQYSSYVGYGNTFRFTGDYIDASPRDESGRCLRSVVSIDALNFNHPVYLPTVPNAGEVRNLNIFHRFLSHFVRYFTWLTSWFHIVSRTSEESITPDTQAYSQYDTKCIDRELNKAYVGFKNPDKKGDLSPVATGNWGCGVFKGDPILKFVLQLLAASETRRDLKYFTFGLKNVKKIETLVNALREGNCTVGAVYVAITHYHLHGGDLVEYLIRKLDLHESKENSASCNHFEDEDNISEKINDTNKVLRIFTSDDIKVGLYKTDIENNITTTTTRNVEIHCEQTVKMKSNTDQDYCN